MFQTVQSVYIFISHFPKSFCLVLFVSFLEKIIFEFFWILRSECYFPVFFCSSWCCHFLFLCSHEIWSLSCLVIIYDFSSSIPYRTRTDWEETNVHFESSDWEILLACCLDREKRCPYSEFDDTFAVSFQISSANLVKSGSKVSLFYFIIRTSKFLSTSVPNSCLISIIPYNSSSFKVWA